jgi:4-hydroxybenzoyl-CoA thioesterase
MSGTNGRFLRERRIRFSDCDPAGIVFFPQYFVMLNGLVEDWVDDALGLGYRNVVVGRRVGLPTVRLEADFKAVSYLGDPVVLSLEVERLGQRSLTLQVRCMGNSDHDLRMGVRQVIVTTSLETHRPIDIPDDLRTAIERFAPGVTHIRGSATG